MKGALKRAAIMLMAVVMFASAPTSYVCAAAPPTAAAAGSSTNAALPEVNLQEKATINIADITRFDKSGKTTAAIMKLAQKYYKLAQPNIERDLKSDFEKNVMPAPAFDGKLTDSKKAASLSGISAVTAISDEALYYSIALACAAFSYDAKASLVSSNLAAAIYRLSPNSYTGKSKLAVNSGLRVEPDVVAIYQYAVSLDPKNPDTLVNLGNIFMDLDRQEDARVLFEAALKVSPNYYRAHEGMAAYYLARKDWAKARKQLTGSILLPASMKKGEDEKKVLADESKAPNIVLEDSAEKAKAAIDKLSKLPLLSTADFIQEIDPIDAQQIRNRINHMPQQDKLILPKLQGLESITSYKSYIDNECSAYMGEANDAFLIKWESEIDAIMGIYGDSGAYQNNEGYESDEYSDDYSDEYSDVYTEAAEAPSMTAYDINTPQIANNSYERSISAYIDRYNRELLSKKQYAYMTYFQNTLSEYRRNIDIARENYVRKIKRLDAEMKAEIASGMDEQRARDKYGAKKNAEREGCFDANFNYAVYQYTNTMKPMIEKYWEDCMPNVRLISDPEVQKSLHYAAAVTAKVAYQQMYEIIHDSAESDGEYDYVSGIALDEDSEELDAKMKKEAQENYDDVNNPSQFSVEFSLENFTIDKSFGPIDLKISPTSIEISGAALLAGKLSYNWNTSRLEGGLGVGIKLGSPATLETSTMITLTVNTNTGKVTEIDWKAGAGASIKVGGVTMGGAYQTSVMNGNKFTPAVSVAYE